MPINNFNSLSTTSYPYSLPLTYNTQYPMSNIYTSNNIVPASTRAIPSVASTRTIPSISSPLVRALYNPAVVQPLKAIKQMGKREAEPGMTYTAEPFDSKMTMAYNSMVNPTYSTTYTFPSTYGYPYMYNPNILPSTYTYTHPSNYGLCLNNLGAQVPC